MARTKAAGDKPAAQPEAETQPTQEEEQDAVLRLVEPNVGVLQGVRCPIEGYNHLTVYYALDNRHEVAEKLRNLPEKVDDEAYHRLLRLFIRRIEGWNAEDDDGNSIPAPNPKDLSTFDMLFKRHYELFRWLQSPGYTKALRINVGESKRRSQKDTKPKKESVSAASEKSAENGGVIAETK